MGSHRSTSGRRAFTLVEAIATIVVISTLGSGASLVIARAVGAYRATATLGQLQSELASAMDRLEREVRKIPRGSGAGADISAATTSGLSWNSSGGACTLSLSGGQVLLATDGGAANPILNDASSLTVQCYGEDGGALSSSLSGSACEAIRRISLTATVTRYGTTATLRTSVYLRSTMTGAQ